jgi:nicotinamide mononucleotide transporter
MEETKKKGKIFTRLWNYFSLYEKIWLFSLSLIGIILAIVFPSESGWLKIFEIITLIGGCSCELLVSKQSKWCFIVSFFFYDLTETIIYFADGYYISALFEIIFWMPILLISFFSWEKHQDIKDANLTVVKKINLKRDLLIFISILLISFITGIIFTYIGFIAEGLSSYWYLDALANTFSVCNGLFLWLRYKEQWLPWYGVCICEAIMWVIAGNYIMLILSIGYITNTTYGLIKWSKYASSHSDEEVLTTSSIK